MSPFFYFPSRLITISFFIIIYIYFMILQYIKDYKKYIISELFMDYPA